MKIVISNKGSNGVDGMTVYELKQFLQTKWTKIREDIFNNEYKLIYDENFSENSFEFHPGRAAKDRIKKAEDYINKEA